MCYIYGLVLDLICFFHFAFPVEKQSNQGKSCHEVYHVKSISLMRERPASAVFPKLNGETFVCYIHLYLTVENTEVMYMNSSK